MKKLIGLLIVFSLGMMGCCSEDHMNWNIQDFSLVFRDKAGADLLDSKIKEDTARLIAVFEQEYVFVEDEISDLFIASANALECPEPGRDGMSDKIQSITVTSSEDFGNILKGNSLNDIIRVNTRDSSGKYMTIDEWIAISGKLPAAYTEFVVFLITQKPEVGTKHIFTVVMKMETGTTIKRDSDEVSWE